jgi:lysophospholipase L1-like esterase
MAHAGGLDTKWLKQLGGRVFFYAITIVTLGIAVGHHAPWPVIVLLAVGLALLGILVHSKLAGLSTASNNAPWNALGLFCAAEIGVVMCVVKQLDTFSIVGFGGLSLAVFGFGQLTAEIRSSDALLWPITVLVAANALGAVVALFFGWGSWVVLVAGLALLSPTLSLTMQLVLDRLGPAREPNVAVAVAVDRAATVRRVAQRWFWIPASLLFLVGAALLVPVGGVGFVVVLAAAVLVLVGMTVSNTDSDMLFVLVGIALIWSQYPRNAPHSLPVPTGGGPRLVVFGDSYISGEGATRFYPGTNVKKSDECRRAETAYPVLVAKARGWDLEDYACSGAKVRNIVSTNGEGQYIGENPSTLRGSDPTTGEVHKLTQLELYDLNNRNGTPVQDQWVLISVGGNDAGFGDLVAACIAPGDCSERGQQFLNNLDTMAKRLGPLYDDLHQRFGDKAVVVPYPVPIRERACGISRSTFTNREHAFINGFTMAMDQIIEATAAAHHLRFLPQMETAFVDPPPTRICDTSAGKASVNYLALNPAGGRADPRDWLHDSMHPNKDGHIVMSEVVRDWLASPGPAPAAPTLPDLKLSTVVAAASHGKVAVEDRCLGSKPKPDCKQSDSEWTYAQTSASFRHHALGIVLVIGGAFGLWFGLLAGLRKWRHDRTEQEYGRFRARVHRLYWLGLTLVVSAVVLALAGWLIGLPNGYNGAQEDSAAKLAALAPSQLRALRHGATLDLALFIPIYVVYGLGVILLLTPPRPSTEPRRPWHAPWVIMLALGAVALADVAETVRFRMTLTRLLAGTPAAQITTTPWLTKVKVGLTVVMIGLLVVHFVWRGDRDPTTAVRNALGRAWDWFGRVLLPT